jgi:hypothetical protein
MEKSFWILLLIIGIAGSLLGGIYLGLTILAFDSGAEMIKLKEGYVFFFGLLLVSISLRKLKGIRRKEYPKFKHLSPGCYQQGGQLSQ